MKRLFIIQVVIVAGIILSTNAIAGDKENIIKISQKHFATLTSGDANAHIAHHLSGHTTFSGDGELLMTNTSLEKEEQDLQADFDAGMKLDFELRHINVQIYGNTAVVTGYIVGNATSPSGEKQNITLRRAAVLVKKGGEWKEVHLHSSPLETGE